MTPDAATMLRKGDYVMHASGMPPRRPIRITQVEKSLTGRVMLRFASLGNCWVPATEYARPLSFWRGDMKEGAWYIPFKNEQGEACRGYVSDEDVRARYHEEMHDDT